MWMRGIYEESRTVPDRSRLERSTRQLVAAGRRLVPSRRREQLLAGRPARTARVLELWNEIDVLLMPVLATTAIAAEGAYGKSAPVAIDRVVAVHAVESAVQRDRAAVDRGAGRVRGRRPTAQRPAGRAAGSGGSRCTRSPASSRPRGRGLNHRPPVCEQVLRQLQELGRGGGEAPPFAARERDVAAQRGLDQRRHRDVARRSGRRRTGGGSRPPCRAPPAA